MDDMPSQRSASVSGQIREEVEEAYSTPNVNGVIFKHVVGFLGQRCDCSLRLIIGLCVWCRRDSGR